MAGLAFLDNWASTKVGSADGGMNVLVLPIDLYSVFFSTVTGYTGVPRSSCQRIVSPFRAGSAGWAEGRRHLLASARASWLTAS